MEIKSGSSLLKLVVNYQRLYIRTAVNLSYKILGDAPNEPGIPPILIFHGLLSGKRHLEGLGKTIMNMTKKSVIVADLRNHGDSPHKSTHGYYQLAEDILQLLNKLEIDRASLMGHCMGGRAIMATSLIAPKKVAGILVVDVSPVSSCPILFEKLHKALEAMGKVDFKGAKDVMKTRKMVLEQIRQTVTDEVLRKTIVSNVRMRPNGTIGFVVNVDAIVKNIEYIASFPNELKELQYDGPALFIGGQLSDQLSPDDLPDIRSMFPQAVITYVQGAGHNVHVDDPKTFLEYTINFLRTIK